VAIHKKTLEITNFIFDNVSQHPNDIASLVANQFGLSRQASNRHLKRLVEKGHILSEGVTRNKSYKLTSQNLLEKEYAVNEQLNEGDVWYRDIAPLLGDLPENIKDIWDYGFTEMFNNVIDHSGSPTVKVFVDKTAAGFKILIADHGEGIFRKIQKALSLTDQRHAVLELAKGKFTTDPDNHSGEGIFFSSRAFDNFMILSDSIHFSHGSDSVHDWIMENTSRVNGTAVFMEINNHSLHNITEIFDDYASEEDDYGFNQTVVPVKLAQNGDGKLVSRSQAKRVLAGLDKFTNILFDFIGVETIGQAFADQIFRIYKNQHPEIKIIYINTNRNLDNMINRALTAKN